MPTTTKAQDSYSYRPKPRVSKAPVVADDEEPQEEVKAHNPVGREFPPDRDDMTYGDADSIANWANRKGAPV